MEFAHSPTTPYVLKQFYQEEAYRIRTQSKDSAQLSGFVFSLMFYAKRRLTLSEIRQALAVANHIQGKHNTALNYNEKEFASALVSSSQGWLQIEPETQLLTWVHESASASLRDPLSKDKDQRGLPISVPKDVASICFSCLALPTFRSGPCRDDKMLRERLTDYPFYEYACEYWAQHASEAENEDCEVLFQFLQNNQSVSAAFEVFLVARGIPQGIFSDRILPRGITGMHLAAYFGLQSILKKLIKARTDDLAVRDSNGHSPLWWAANNRMKETAKILIPKDHEAVHLLVRMGNSDVVQMLLGVGFDLNRTGAWGRTLLHNAIMDDQAAIARNLLEKGAKVDKTDINGDTPLTLALQKEQRQIADVLLDMGASTRNTTVEQWRKAYAKPGHSVIQLNLEAGKTCIGFLTGNTQDAIQSATLAQSQATNLL
jgi:hypothetical protein